MTPPWIRILAGLVLLALVYYVAPRLLVTTMGLVALYLVLTYGTDVSRILGDLPATLARVLNAAPSSSGGEGGGGNGRTLIR